MLRVKEICKEEGITIATLAGRIGMLPSALSRIINGANTTTETLQKIANALNVSVIDLFDHQKRSFAFCPKCGTRLELKEVDLIAEKLAREHNTTPE